MFIRLQPWSERRGASHSINAILGRVNGMMYMGLTHAQAFAVNPPSIPGLGFQGGFAYQVEDRANQGIPALYKAAGAGGRTRRIRPIDPKRTYTSFRLDKPTIVADVDRDKALSLGIPLASLFNTMQVYLGSVYVNDFDTNGKSYRVEVQADGPFRSSVSDLSSIYVRSTTPVFSNGQLVQTAPIPLSALMTLKQKLIPADDHALQPLPLDRGRWFARARDTAPEKRSRRSRRHASYLPPGYAGEWSGISREQQEGGSQAAIIFGLGIIFVFLVLAAQYESFADPLIILFAVPLAVLGALAGLFVRHAFSDIFAQVGYVMLIGLASKNAILIVEFANQQREQGVDAVTAVMRAAETRLRPILMTSIAFVLGVTPLVFASGAGSGARNSLGTAVFGGMILSTILNLFITPVLYVFISGFEDRMGFGRGKHGAAAKGANGASEGVTGVASPPQPVRL